MLSSDDVEVLEDYPVNDECMFVNYKQSAGFEAPPKNTNAVVASYVTTHARLELYEYLSKLGDRALYCDTDR